MICFGFFGSGLGFALFSERRAENILASLRLIFRFIHLLLNEAFCHGREIPPLVEAKKYSIESYFSGSP